MSGKDLKLEWRLGEDALARVLRALGDVLGDVMDEAAAEEGEVMAFPDLDGLDLDGLKRIKLRASRKSDGVRLKLKASFYEDEDDEPDDVDEDRPARSGDRSDPSGRPKYKRLKKRMKYDFKAIQAAVEAGSLPDPALAEVFVRDSRLMVLYPGKGDEYYPDYKAAAEAFADACATGDIDAVRAAVDELARLKKACHDRYE